MKQFSGVSIVLFVGLISVLEMFPMSAFATATPTGATAPPAISGPKTPVQRLQLRFQHEISLIQLDQKKGKLTAVQAKALKTQVMAVHQQELTFLKADGKSGLTDEQTSQLFGQYNALSKTIPYK